MCGTIVDPPCSHEDEIKMICKVCGKRCNYKTIGGVCSDTCADKEDQQNADKLERMVYRFVLDKTSHNELDLHNWEKVKAALEKCIHNLSMSW
jgi:hypothetical protein